MTLRKLNRWDEHHQEFGKDNGGGFVVWATADCRIRDIEVGTTTGWLVQTNAAKQVASNLAYGGRGKAQANHQDAWQDNVVVAQGDADFGVKVKGAFKGKIWDIEVGQITGDIAQANFLKQAASNLAYGGRGKAQANDQEVSQLNAVVAKGDVDFDIVVNGAFKGSISDVEVGLITADITQTNTAKQAAGNVSAGGRGGAQANVQGVEQINYVEALGDLEVDLVFNGDFSGTVRDLEVGLIAGDVVQANQAKQAATNAASGKGVGGLQTIDQEAWQANVLSVAYDLDITLLFDGDFKGNVRDVTVGVVAEDISQTNTAIQVGMNIAAGPAGGSQAIEQFITQTNTIDADGDIDVVIRFDTAGYKGDYRDIEISLLIDNILQSNAAFQSASNTVWH